MKFYTEGSFYFVAIILILATVIIGLTVGYIFTYNVLLGLWTICSLTCMCLIIELFSTLSRISSYEVEEDI